MTKLAAKRKYNRTIREVVALLIQDCTERTPGWASALMDVRGAPGNKSTVSKMRVTMQDGLVVKHLPAPFKVRMLFLNVIWTIKDIAFAEKQWSGIQLTISSGGATAIAYLYDIDCINDPAFYESDSEK